MKPMIVLLSCLLLLSGCQTKTEIPETETAPEIVTKEVQQETISETETISAETETVVELPQADLTKVLTPEDMMMELEFPVWEEQDVSAVQPYFTGKNLETVCGMDVILELIDKETDALYLTIHNPDSCYRQLEILVYSHAMDVSIPRLTVSVKPSHSTTIAVPLQHEFADNISELCLAVYCNGQRYSATTKQANVLEKDTPTDLDCTFYLWDNSGYLFAGGNSSIPIELPEELVRGFTTIYHYD